MKGCEFLVQDCTMDGTDYDCEHPTYGKKYGCDHCPMFGRNGNKRQYRLVNFRQKGITLEIAPGGDCAGGSAGKVLYIFGEGVINIDA